MSVLEAIYRFERDDIPYPGGVKGMCEWVGMGELDQHYAQLAQFDRTEDMRAEEMAAAENRRRSFTGAQGEDALRRFIMQGQAAAPPARRVPRTPPAAPVVAPPHNEELRRRRR